MRILHICNDYYGTKLYRNLFQNLLKNNFLQDVFIFIKKNQQTDIVSEYLINGINNIVLNIDFLKSYLFRFLFDYRNKQLFNYIQNNINLNEYGLVYAHTWFTNGGLALTIKKKLNIPYIVAIRNVDVNYIYKYLFFHRKKGIEILKEAEKIIFISHAYKNKVWELIKDKNDKILIAEKSLVIPNSLDTFWFENKGIQKNYNSSELNLLFVGEITRNKRILEVIRAVIEMNTSGMKSNLVIIGDKKPVLFNSSYFKKIIEASEKYDFIKYKGPVKNKKELLEFYRKADIFVMPSKFETFGLVYVEALTQGTPIIYTKGQGIDGYFQEGEIGYGVKDGSKKEIIESIRKILDKYQHISEKCIINSDEFKIEKINKQYVELLSVK